MNENVAQFIKNTAYQVSIEENLVNVFVHLVVIDGHKERVDDNAQCDEELHEGVKDDEGD